VSVGLAAAREGIDVFWAAWPEIRRDLDLAVEARDTEGVLAAVGGRVAAIHPDLAWEHAKGISASSALVVSAEGKRELRATAERWLRAAPAPDEAWEFHAARQPDPEALAYRLELEGEALELERTKIAFKIDRKHSVVDVAVHHPDLKRLQSPATFAFLVLDWLLGEDGVERWIGTVEAKVRSPLRAGAPQKLLKAVEALALANADGSWVILEAETPAGLPLVAVALSPMKPVDYPLLDLFVSLALPYREQNDGWLPVGSSVEALAASESELEELLGERGLIVAHDAVDGVRTIYAYADAESSVGDEAAELAATWAEGEAAVTVLVDPSWDGVAHLRV
jgi:hypothetical protein